MQVAHSLFWTSKPATAISEIGYQGGGSIRNRLRWRYGAGGGVAVCEVVIRMGAANGVHAGMFWHRVRCQPVTRKKFGTVKSEKWVPASRVYYTDALFAQEG
jgi:hypothetical protein